MTSAQQSKGDHGQAGPIASGSRVRQAPPVVEDKKNEQGHRLVPLSDLDRALVAANDISSLAELLKQAKGVHELMRTMDWALEEQNRAAEFRIRVARKLGTHLTRAVSRGGKSLSPERNSRRGGTPHPLPAGISRMQSSRLQRLASIPDDAFEDYLAESRKKRTSITVASLMRAYRRFSNTESPEPVKDSEPDGADQCFAAVYKATRQVMNVGMTVGVPARELGATEELNPDIEASSRLHGSVFVLAKRDAESWLGKLASARRRNRIHEVVAVLPALVDQPWFQEIAEHRWLCCLLRKTKGMLRPFTAAYHGERRHAFWLVFNQLGVVLEPPQF